MKFCEDEDIPRTYGEVRDLVVDGDVFLFKGQYLPSKVFRFIDKSYYSHAGLAAWWDDRLMLLQAELRPGVQAVPMSVAISQYKGRVDWYKLLRDSFKDCDVAECNRRLQQRVMLRAKALLGVPYALRALLLNFLRRWIAKIPITDKMHPTAMFCTQYVEECFDNADLSLSHKKPVLTFPTDLRNSEHLKYMGTIPHDPDLVPSRDRDEVVTRVRDRVEKSIADSTHPH
jgi:hypothetical protein